MIKLAENQLGGLPLGDRAVTSGAVADRLRSLFRYLSFEQMRLVYSCVLPISRHSGLIRAIHCPAYGP